MLVNGINGRGLAEVDAHSIAHYGFAVEDLPDADGIFDCEERDYDAAEGF